MNKIFAIMGATLFMLGFGISYAGGLNNGVTDFSGRTYDVLETSPATGVEHSAFEEGSAAGGIRLVESDNGKLHNGVTDFSGRTYDTLEISPAPIVGNVAEGSAAGGPRQNFAGEESSVRTYDSLPIRW